MNFQIITDSCCDFTDEQYARLGVSYVPLTVMWDGQSHDHFGSEAALKDFYTRMRQGLLATTSALNPDNWMRAMEPHLRQGRDLLVMAVSSGISGTYQSAVIAAAELRDLYPQRVIRVIDTLSGSLGEGLLVWHACRMRDAGQKLEQIAAWLEEHARKVCHWVTVDNLQNLARSGRLNTAAAALGTMLNIKPVIKVTGEGKLTATAKARGRKASIRALAKKFAESRCPDGDDLVTIAHGDCPEDAAALETILREEYGIKNILTGFVGPILGAHTGPGVLGLFHLGTDR